MTMEKIICSGVTLEIPSDLSQDVSLLFEIISPDTWNNLLTDEHRESLMGFLPDFPENDLEEKTRTLEMFFMDEPFRFGTPLREFHDLLQKGRLNPDVARMREIHQKILYKEYRYRQRKYLHNLLEDVLVRRKHVLDTVAQLPPEDVPRIPKLPFMSSQKRAMQTSLEHRCRKRYFRELEAIRAEAGDFSESSDEDGYPDGRGICLSKKQRRQLTGVESTLPGELQVVRGTQSSGSVALDLEMAITPMTNPLDLSDDHLRAMLGEHRERRRKGELSPDLDTQGITIEDVNSRTQMPTKRPAARALSYLTPPSERGRRPPPKALTAPPQLPRYTLAPLPTHFSGHVQRGGMLGRGGRDAMDSSSCSSGDETEDSDDFNLSVVPPAIESQSSKKKVVRGRTGQAATGRMGQAGGKSRQIGAVKLEKFEKLPSEMSVFSPSIKSEIKVEVDGREDNWGWNESSIKTEEVLKENDILTAVESGACIAPELTQETHICFLSLLRDIICSTSEQRMARHQLMASVRVWQESAISPLNEWFSLAPSWEEALSSALGFLCGFYTELQPSDFVPYLEYKSQSQVYQWIGAGRDSDGHLGRLNDHWLMQRHLMSNDWIQEVENSMERSEDLNPSEPEEVDPIPPPRFFTTWTVKQATEAERRSFRLQEKTRFQQPHKAFIYRMHGYESVVGPIKGIFSQNATAGTRARGHQLLAPERPPYVTILSLVRDAVARLPNGEGSRVDICELLKESQYLATPRSLSVEAILHNVVSGALDRLHYEADPSVKYDATRKQWIYLHRNRSEEEFERMHHLHGPSTNRGGKKSTPRKLNRGKGKGEATGAGTNSPIELDGATIELQAEELKTTSEMRTPSSGVSAGSSKNGNSTGVGIAIGQRNFKNLGKEQDGKSLPRGSIESPISDSTKVCHAPEPTKVELTLSQSRVTQMTQPPIPRGGLTNVRMTKLVSTLPGASKGIVIQQGINLVDNLPNISGLSAQLIFPVISKSQKVPTGSRNFAHAAVQQIPRMMTPVTTSAVTAAIGSASVVSNMTDLKGIRMVTVTTDPSGMRMVTGVTDAAGIRMMTGVNKGSIVSMTDVKEPTRTAQVIPQVSTQIVNIKQLVEAVKPVLKARRGGGRRGHPKSFPVVSSSVATSNVPTMMQLPLGKSNVAGQTNPVVVTSAGSKIIASSMNTIEMASVNSTKGTMPPLGTFKMVQSNSQSLGTGTTSVVVNSAAALQSLMGQKMVFSGGKVYLQGGKQMVQALANQLSVGQQQQIIPRGGQQVVSVASLLGVPSSGATSVAVSSMSGHKLPTGSVLQFTNAPGGRGGVPRLALVSAGLGGVVGSSRVMLTATSQAGKHDSNTVSQMVQNIQVSGPQVVQGTGGTTQTVFSGPTMTVAGQGGQRFLAVAGPAQQRAFLQGVTIGGKPALLTGGGFRFLQPSVSGSATSVATISGTTASLINIGGKQLLVASNSNKQTQLQQVTSQGVLVASAGGGQQLMLPASALQGVGGAAVSVKGLQSFQTLKVVNATPVAGGSRGKAVIARFVSPANHANTVSQDTTGTVSIKKSGPSSGQ